MKPWPTTLTAGRGWTLKVIIHIISNFGLSALILCTHSLVRYQITRMLGGLTVIVDQFCYTVNSPPPPPTLSHTLRNKVPSSASIFPERGISIPGSVSVGIMVGSKKALGQLKRPISRSLLLSVLVQVETSEAEKEKELNLENKTTSSFIDQLNQPTKTSASTIHPDYTSGDYWSISHAIIRAQLPTDVFEATGAGRRFSCPG